MKYDKMKILGIILGIVIAFMLIFIILILPNISTYGVYIGFYNDTNYELGKQACGDDFFVGIDGGCNRISVYCAKFWYPYHIFVHCYDGRQEVVWR